MVTTRYSDDTPAGLILRHLQRNSKATVRELEQLLGISTTAVRDHLLSLQHDGLVVAGSERHGPGRPRLVYTLTEKAQSLSPRQYESLLAGLLGELLAREGREHVAELLNRVGHRLAVEYRDRIQGTDVRERLGQLQRLLESRGIPAEVTRDGFTIHLFACPFYEVAQGHPEVCSMERQMLEYVLGEEVALGQTIREGHHTCHFVVRES